MRFERTGTSLKQKLGSGVPISVKLSVQCRRRKDLESYADWICVEIPASGGFHYFIRNSYFLPLFVKWHSFNIAKTLNKSLTSPGFVFTFMAILICLELTGSLALCFIQRTERLRRLTGRFLYTLFCSTMSMWIRAETFLTCAFYTPPLQQKVSAVNNLVIFHVPFIRNSFIMQSTRGNLLDCIFVFYTKLSWHVLIHWAWWLIEWFKRSRRICDRKIYIYCQECHKSIS